MQAVTGQDFSYREATAQNFARYLIQDRIYPGMILAKGEMTSGRLYEGIDSRTLKILDTFEDEVYTRTLITVHTQDGKKIEAYSYIIPQEHQDILTSLSWDRDHFVAHDLPTYIKACHGFNCEWSSAPYQ